MLGIVATTELKSLLHDIPLLPQDAGFMIF